MDFGAFLKSKRSRDKIIQVNIDRKLSLYFSRRACPVTARQYGEVVLPDAFRPRIESFNSEKICLKPGKEGMAHFLPSRYNADLIIRVSRYKF